LISTKILVALFQCNRSATLELREQQAAEPQYKILPAT
jgi:hypothetical protein